jgi:hypothetical protein
VLGTAQIHTACEGLARQAIQRSDGVVDNGVKTRDGLAGTNAFSNNRDDREDVHA